MSPTDRLGNKYMTNSIDHRTSYCRVFLAKTKDATAQKIKHFMAFFGLQFNCRTHVLKTDSGDEYQTLDLLYKDTGIAQQASEQRNRVSNGKAERMHRTILNMVRSMEFAYGLLLNFWGDVAGYATTYRVGKKTHDLSDIVVFGSSCTVDRDVKNKSLGKRGKPGLIAGKSDGMKGHQVYIPEEQSAVYRALHDARHQLCRSQGDTTNASPDHE
ncbi:hypothetical protein PR001_g27118 [Phytophthora rubi]|nr:hypothetical protein PR002_g27229 [Phytophthora rubi]KAE8970728.1 hypothetical protein PR001_g27118 [Phytophthora rubi]